MNFVIPGLRRGVNVMNGVDPFAVEGPGGLDDVAGTVNDVVVGGVNR